MSSRHAGPWRRASSCVVASLSALVAFAGLSGCGPGLARASGGATQPGPAATRELAGTLRMQRVVLFTSGVGYFEQGGTVTGNQRCELSVRTSQLDDLLKSLVFEDLRGGHVDLVEYPSFDPLNKSLAAFCVNLSQRPSLAQLLTQLRGSPVTVQVHATVLHGTILGIQYVEVRLAEGVAPIQRTILQLLEGQAIREIPLEEVTQLHFDDPQVQTDLVHALQTIAREHHGDSTTMSIQCDGHGSRPVRCGFVVQAPVWKTCYRLVLDDTQATGAKLQGWAIIENETGEDWIGVPVSLVSGRPISFIEALSRPRYLQRAVISPRLAQEITPDIHRGAELRLPAFGVLQMEVRRSGGGRKRARLEQPQGPLDLTRSIQAAAQASTLDARTVFTVASVSVPRQHSAMIPILNEGISAEPVSIYRGQGLDVHPLCGAIITNTTSKDLLQGPVTVLGSEGYRGDAVLDSLPPGDHRLMSFASDLAVRAEESGATLTTQVVQSGISSGVLHLSVRDLRSVTYRFANSSAQARTLVVEHPRDSRWSLLESPQPWEQTPASYRWKLPLAPGGECALVVHEASQRREAISINAMDDARLLALSRDGSLPAAVVQELVRVMQIRRSLAQQEQLRRQTLAAITALGADQQRIRRTLSVLEHRSALYQRLLDRMTVQETALEARQQVLAQCQQQVHDLMGQLDGGINAQQPR